jgi:hypothetical protein
MTTLLVAATLFTVSGLMMFGLYNCGKAYQIITKSLIAIRLKAHPVTGKYL